MSLLLMLSVAGMVAAGCLAMAPLVLTLLETGADHD